MEQREHKFMTGLTPPFQTLACLNAMVKKWRGLIRAHNLCSLSLHKLCAH